MLAEILFMQPRLLIRGQWGIQKEPDLASALRDDRQQGGESVQTGTVSRDADTDRSRCLRWGWPEAVRCTTHGDNLPEKLTRG
jgi:hypothetical protein